MKSLSKLGKQLGDLGDKIRRTPVKQRGRRQEEKDTLDGRSVLVITAESEEEREASLRSLHASYFFEEFDALDHELKQLPANFEANSLDSIVEERTTVLEVVSEKLSLHVMQNYDKFVEGVNEVTYVEEDLQAAHVIAKSSRERLAVALREVNNGIRIAKDTRQKQALTSLLEVLCRLQQANNLQRALKEAQEEGQYAEAFWLCAQCMKSMDELGDDLQVASQLTVSINLMYEDTTHRLESALAAVCSDFRPDHYSKVLEGYMFLDNVDQLGTEVKTAFVNTINGAVQKVVRGVLLTRQGFEEKAAVASNLQDLVRYLPSDLFRTCLARVLMMLFDILVSHFHMVRWHEASLARHEHDLASLGTTQQLLREQLEGSRGSNACTAEPGQLAKQDTASLASQQLQQQQQQQQGMSDSGAGGSVLHGTQDEIDSPVTVTGRAMMQLQRGTASELEEVEAKVSDEAEWGAVLQAVHAGLLGGRKLIWDEAARRVGVLLGIPAAFEGEHFLQVMDWTQRVLAIGESFSGVECAGLRTLLQRQSGNFFKAFHASNIEALNSMLDKELWKRLPVSMPSMGERLASQHDAEDSVASFADFEHYVTRGNPWRRQQGSPRRRSKKHDRLGFAGATIMEDSKVAQQLEVDEYGIPRTASNDISSSGRASTDQTEHLPSPWKDESEELFGDFIDEETQSVRTVDGQDASSAGRDSNAAAVVTNSSWRMMKWMRDYCQLMRTLRTATPTIFVGLTELYDLYLLHIYISFGEVPLPDLLPLAQHLSQGSSTSLLPAAAADALTPRLRSTLQRIATESIGKYRGLLGHQPGSKLVAAMTARESGLPGASAHHMDNLKDKLAMKESAGSYFGRKGSSSVAGTAATMAAMASGDISMVANSGNMYGLQERVVAVQSLLVVAQELSRARAELSGLLPPSEAPTLDQFYSRGVGAAEDLRDHVLRAGARLLLPIKWLPERVAVTNYALSEPPTRHQPWVDELHKSLSHYKDCLSTVSSLPPESLLQLWQHGAAYVAECILEGIARVRRCTLEGRAGMSVDLQATSRALQRFAPPGSTISMRLVDNYIKGFYIPLEEFTHWAQVHPEYRLEQMLALAACIAESSGLKRKDKQALLAQVEHDLKALSLENPV